MKAAGVAHDVITVPGALEIPAAIVIALDAAEKNGKPYDAASRSAAWCAANHRFRNRLDGIVPSADGSIGCAGVPLGNGIITVNTDAQAWARARASELNKGGDAARAALAMLRIKRRLAKA